MKIPALAVLLCLSCATAPSRTGSTSSSASPRDPRERRLVVDEVGALGLFESEELVARSMVFAWAQAQGWTLVPLERSESIFARARAGQRITTGEACGAPLPAWRASERYAPALGAEGRGAIVQCESRQGDDPAASCLCAALRSAGRAPAAARATRLDATVS